VSAVKTATTEVAESSVYQQLRQHLAYLQMTAAAEPLAPVLDRARTERVSATQVLEELLHVEVEATRAQRQHGRLRLARYPVRKTLAAFDFESSPALIAAWLQNSRRIG
jgi:DNA replication protein DnaC